jgi:hypothetical protein
MHLSYAITRLRLEARGPHGGRDVLLRDGTKVARQRTPYRNERHMHTSPLEFNPFGILPETV